jgi:hypothetical protein
VFSRECSYLLRNIWRNKFISRGKDYTRYRVLLPVAPTVRFPFSLCWIVIFLWAVRSEVVMAVTMNSTVLWDMRPYDLLVTSECFGGTCLLHLQDRRVDVMSCDLVDGFQLFRWTWCLLIRGRIMDMTPYRLVDWYQYFGGTSCSQIQGLRVIWRSKNW